MTKEALKNKIVEALKQVYDPEFPVVDIRTLGMIYDIDIKENEKKVYILMTLTSPMCPMADMILDSVKNAIKEISDFKDWEVDIELTFDPMWNPDMIKDEDIKKMFS